MNDEELFRIVFGITMVIVSGVWLALFLRNMKNSNDDSEMLSLARLKLVLTLISGLILGLFIIFYKMF